MFGRAMADRHGVGIIVSIDYHGASYDIQTPRLLCKHLTAAEVHPVPAGLTLAHRLGPDATPARRFAATAVDDGTLQRLFEAYKPDSDAPDHLLHRQTRYAFAQAAETLNWRGMADSGGRRIMREYALKLDYIKPCTPEFLERMKAFDDELAKFITEKQQQAAAGKVANTDNPAGLVNGTIDTNAGLLRAYMNLYLRRHPFVNKDLLLMVRTLAPTENGLPVQIYCFSANKNWPSYESIQAEIMEHFVSVLPAFELYPFQNAGARDMIVSGFVESGKVDLSAIDGIPWHTVLPEKKNGQAEADQ